MKQIIQKIYNKRTDYSHSDQATTTANALDILSSGIYTEEERFIFELLQNAVDSYEPALNFTLDVRIVLQNNYLIFLHNGTVFSERDIAGLCDIGNSNKMHDAKKIGYKGIGFKSVFLHSDDVTVMSGDSFFKFDKKACQNIAKEKWPDEDGVKMPWQIIPILTEKPCDIDVEGYNVATFIKINPLRKELLKKKIGKLLSDSRFMLFLKVENLHITFFDEEKAIISLGKSFEDGMLSIYQNDELISKWLIHSDDIKLTKDVKEALVHDQKTPDKLKDSESVEISFAISLDQNNKIVPIENAVVYTYLPTSFSFGFNFLVNANFITDAGRQQLIKDCEWNKFIFANIPSLYLKWIENEIGKKHKNWYEVLPCISSKDDEISIVYSSALENAINTIPFVQTIKGESIIIEAALVDLIGLDKAVSKKVYDNFIQEQISTDVSHATLVSNDATNALSNFGIKTLTFSHLIKFLELSDIYLKSIRKNAASLIKFYQWLQQKSEEKGSDFKHQISYSKIVPDEDDILTEPVNLFFPSNYRDENSLAEDAKVMNPSLFESLTEELKDCLQELGVQEMSNLSVIENVLCKDGYINEDNAIEIVRFIFDSEKKEKILDNLSDQKKKEIKVLTFSGKLIKACEAFLDKTYGTEINLPESVASSFFVSNKYIRNYDNTIDWQIFFRKLHANTEINIIERPFEKGTDIYNSLSTYVEYCTEHEKKYGLYPIHKTGLYVHKFISAQLPPILSFETGCERESWKYDLYKFIWTEIMKKPIALNDRRDYIAGHTGFNYYAYGYLKDNVEGHRYLGEFLIQYLIRKRKLLPGNDGSLHYASDLLAPSDLNWQVFGNYALMLSLDSNLDDSWLDFIQFKNHLSIYEYLEVLEKISFDDSPTMISENRGRIHRIYGLMADEGWDLNEGSNNFNIFHEWGKTHKILSKDGSFELPENLYLLSPKLSGIELENHVSVTSALLRNNRFYNLMHALGVNFVETHSVEGLEDAEKDLEIQNDIKRKSEFLTLLASSDEFNETTWEVALAETQNKINDISIYNVPEILVKYGNQLFPKLIYVKDSDFYYTGNFRPSIQELLSEDLTKALGIPKKNLSIFLTILRMKDFNEILDYMEYKGFDIQFISRQGDLVVSNDPKRPIGDVEGEDYYGGLSKAQMIEALETARTEILSKLEQDGYDISNWSLDGPTCINGVTKDGVEYPLVVHSNVWGKPTSFTAEDWPQLLKDNAMFVVKSSEGIGTIRFRDALMSREKIRISFDTANLEIQHHITELAQLFKFFKGLNFNFGSYIQPLMSKWERFMAPEKQTGELPESSILPE